MSYIIGIIGNSHICTLLFDAPIVVLVFHRRSSPGTVNQYHKCTISRYLYFSGAQLAPSGTEIRVKM